MSTVTVGELIDILMQHDNLIEVVVDVETESWSTEVDTRPDGSAYVVALRPGSFRGSSAPSP